MNEIIILWNPYIIILKGSENIVINSLLVHMFIPERDKSFLETFTQLWKNNIAFLKIQLDEITK